MALKQTRVARAVKKRTAIGIARQGCAAVRTTRSALRERGITAVGGAAS